MMCFLSVSLFGQTETQTKAYILFKGYPYVVYLSPEGDITEFIRAAPEVMNGVAFDKDQPMPIALGPYTKPAPTELPVYNSPQNTTTIDDVEIVDFEIKEHVDVFEETATDQTSQEQEEEIAFKTTVINKVDEEDKEALIVRKELDKTVEDGLYILKFQGFTSRLTPALIDLLSDISKEHKQNSDKQLIINSFMTQGDASNRKLAENRMAACRDLLETYGVPADKMSTEILPYNSAIDGNVSIKFED